jgi:hypothetical protein
MTISIKNGNKIMGALKKNNGKNIGTGIVGETRRIRNVLSLAPL